MNYYMPKHGHLSLHSSCNVGLDDPNDVTLFFGLSGTGKTSLSADPKRGLIGDDEHVWTKDGIFNIEGGCYAKVNGLKKEKEPEIYNATNSSQAIIENVIINNEGNIDFEDDTITKNTRSCYPLSIIENALDKSLAPHPAQRYSPSLFS